VFEWGGLLMKTLFLDESGKTGTQRYHGIWNFQDKPYFILCGVLVPGDKVDQLNASIEELYALFKIQDHELKASKKAVRKNIDEIMTRLWNIQKNTGCTLYAEVVDKRFCIARLITDYCAVPYYELPENYQSFPELWMLKRSFANHIYETISDELLGTFTEFFDSGTHDIQALEALCLRLIQESGNALLSDCVKKAIACFTNHEQLGLLQRHVFPLLDHYNDGTSSVAVSPHIDSFNNILSRAILRPGSEKYVIIHDRISELENALRKTFTDRGFPNSELLFKKAKKTPGIQAADFWGGNIETAVQDVLQERGTSKIMNTILQKNVNFVGTYSQQVRLFPYNLDRVKEKMLYDQVFHKK